MDSPVANEAIEKVLYDILRERSLEGLVLKNEQLELSRKVNGKDVLAVLPTGYGKSLIFQLLPDILGCFFGVSNSIVLVCSPLNALMQRILNY